MPSQSEVIFHDFADRYDLHFLLKISRSACLYAFALYGRKGKFSHKKNQIKERLKIS